MIGIIWLRLSPDTAAGTTILQETPLMPISLKEATAMAEDGLLTVQALSLRPNGYSLFDEDRNVIMTHVT